MKKTICIFSFISTLLITIFVSACNNVSMLKTIPFNLNTMSEDFDPPKATLFKSFAEFNIFLSDTSIFEEELSIEFSEVNAQYDENFFNESNLIALILHSTSSMIEGYYLKQIYKENDFWAIALDSVSDDNVTTDMGRYFCYYITVEKDENISNVKVHY